MNGACGISYVYVLKLQNDKYYVGQTNNPTSRIKYHFDGHGSSWTALHRPVEIISVEQGGKELEKLRTLQMMRRHGWANVRGYAWCQIELVNPPVDLR